MKPLIFLLTILLVITGCDVKEPQDERITKEIVGKKESLGSYYNLFTDKQVLETKYYLIARDGTYITVDVGQYMTAQPGDLYKSNYWKR